MIALRAVRNLNLTVKDHRIQTKGLMNRIDPDKRSLPPVKLGTKLLFKIAGCVVFSQIIAIIHLYDLHFRQKHFLQSAKLFPVLLIHILIRIGCIYVIHSRF